MHYGEGWACDSTQSHSKRARPTYTDPEDDRMNHCQLDRRPRRTTQRKMATFGGSVTEVRVGRIPLLHQDNGGQGCGTKGPFPALLGIPQTPATQCTTSGAYVKMIAMA